MFTAGTNLGRNVNFTVTVFVKSQILIRLISFPIILCKFCHTWEKSNEHCCHSTQNRNKSYHALGKPNICSQYLLKGKHEILRAQSLHEHTRHFMFLGHSTEDSLFSLDTGFYLQKYQVLITYIFILGTPWAHVPFFHVIKKGSFSIRTLPLATIKHKFFFRHTNATHTSYYSAQNLTIQGLYLRENANGSAGGLQCDNLCANRPVIPEKRSFNMAT